MAQRHSKNPNDATTRHETAEAVFSVAAELAEQGHDVSMIDEVALGVLEEGDA